MANHTPGPWRHNPESGYIGAIHADKTIVANVSAQIGPGHKETIEANIALIAAAPAMLEALEGILRVADDDGKIFRVRITSDSGVATKIRSAVAAAKGQLTEPPAAP